jgi:hypothetical protein
VRGSEQTLNAREKRARGIGTSRMRFVADAMATWAVGTAFFLGNLFSKSFSSIDAVGFPRRARRAARSAPSDQ